MMETFTSKAQLIDSGRQRKRAVRLKHLSKRLKTNYKKKNIKEEAPQKQSN